MADTTITLNAPTVAGGPVMGTATDTANANYQKIVVGNDIGGIAAPVTVSNPLAVAQTGTATVAGAGASGGTNTGNPVKVGGAFNSVAPTVSNGSVVDFQTDINGNLKVNIAAGAAAGGTSSSFAAAFPAVGTAVGATNGTNMVALQADASGFLKVNVAAGATQAVVDNSTGFTSGTSQALPIAGFFATSPTALTSGDFGIPWMAKTRQLRVVVDADSNATAGLTSVFAIAPATPAAQAVKNSAGVVAHIHAGNILTTPVWLKFYNIASGSVTPGSSTIYAQYLIPGNSAASGAGIIISLPTPLIFSTAISWAVTGLIGAADTTAITANSVLVEIGYA